MKVSRCLHLLRFLVVILLFGIGQVSLAIPKEAKEVITRVNGEIQTDHHLTYEMPNSGHTMLLVEGNYQLPTVNELRPNLNLFYPNAISCLSELKEKELLFLKREVQIIASLDGLTIIYPFHTFL